MVHASRVQMRAADHGVTLVVVSRQGRETLNDPQISVRRAAPSGDMTGVKGSTSDDTCCQQENPGRLPGRVHHMRWSCRGLSAWRPMALRKEDRMSIRQVLGVVMVVCW